MNWILILLYTYQGSLICTFTQIFPMLMAERGFTFEQQGLYSIVNYPFNFKLIFAPFVDLYYSNTLGRRKSYILPIFVLNSSLLLILARIDIFANFNTLQFLGFIICLLLGIQDVALDGLAFEICKDKNMSAPVHQNVGLILGMSIFGNIFFNILNTYNYITIEKFLLFNSAMGILLFLITISRLKESKMEEKARQSFQSLKAASVQFFSQKVMVQFLILSFFEKYALCTIDATFRIKLIKIGFTKAQVSYVDFVLLPIKLSSGMIYQKYFKHYDFFYFNSLNALRLLPNIVASITLYAIEFQLLEGSSSFIAVLFCSIFWYTLFNIQFIIRGNFVQKISLKGYEASSITILNSVSQLGFKSASSLSLFAASQMDFYQLQMLSAACHLTFVGCFSKYYERIYTKFQKAKER